MGVDYSYLDIDLSLIHISLKDVIGRISRNETGKLNVHSVCPELKEFFDELKKYPAISGERTIPYFIFHGGDIAKLARCV